MANIPNPQELKQILNQKNSNLILLDVRTSMEFEEGHLKGAKNLNVSDPDFMSKIEKLDKTKNYIVYCQSGGRSQMAEMLMKQKGLNISNCLFGMRHMAGGDLEVISID